MFLDIIVLKLKLYSIQELELFPVSTSGSSVWHVSCRCIHVGYIAAGQEKHGSPLVQFIVPLFQSAEEATASGCGVPPRPVPAVQRSRHCHSVYLTFHLTAGNRTSVLSCVCEDNREPAYSRCLECQRLPVCSNAPVQVQGSQQASACRSCRIGFGFPSSAAFSVACSALMLLNNILDYFKRGCDSVQCNSCTKRIQDSIYLRKKWSGLLFVSAIYFYNNHFVCLILYTMKHPTDMTTM